MIVNLVGLVLTLLGMVLAVSTKGRFERLYDEFGIRLPALTELLLQDWVVWIWGLSLLGVFGLGLAIRQDAKWSSVMAAVGVVGLCLVGMVHFIGYYLPFVEITNQIGG